MFYRRDEIINGEKIANFGVILVNTLSTLNLIFVIVRSKTLSIDILRKDLFFELFIIIITIFYYRGSYVAYEIMIFLIEPGFFAILIVPILLLTSILADFGLLEYGGGILYIVFPLVLATIGIFLSLNTKSSDDFFTYIAYRKDNLKK